MDEEKKDIKEEPKEATKSITLFKDPLIQDLILSCDEDFVLHINLTKKEIRDLKKFASLLKLGDHNVVPMICTGDRCICRARCPFVKMKKMPMGKECPFERYAFNLWYKEYVEDLAIDVNSKVQRQQVMDLVETDIMNARANFVLGDEGFEISNPVGFNEDTGEAILRREEHIALRLKDRVQARKDKIWKSFVATRESQIKAAASSSKGDPTELMANLRARGAEIEEGHVVDAKTRDTIVKKEENKPQKQEVDNDDPF